VSIIGGPQATGELDYLQIAVFAGLALASWWLLKSFARLADRIAALLYGLFYATRITTNFVQGAAKDALTETGAAIISVGMVAVIIGVIRDLSRKKGNDADIGCG
jgi:hypothetical protein